MIGYKGRWYFFNWLNIVRFNIKINICNIDKDKLYFEFV